MPDPVPSADESPNCYGCRHFFVTHDAHRPYGCRAFEMKSSTLPSGEVLRSSGLPCGAFEAKGKQSGGRRGGERGLRA